MKKLWSIVVAIAMVGALTVPVFADTTVQENTVPPTGDTQLTFSVDPTYTVTIPATVTLDKDESEGVKYIGTGTVSADAGLRLEEGKRIEVTLTTCDYLLDTAATATYQLPYTVMAGTTPIENATTPVATFTTEANANVQSSVLTFTAGDPTYAGEYSDTVTFTIAVVG